MSRNSVLLAILIAMILGIFACRPAPEDITTEPVPAPEPTSLPVPLPTPAPEITPEPAPTPEIKKEPKLAGCWEQLRGQADPDITVDIYYPEKAYNGTTLLPDNHNSVASRIIEVNMSGEIIWEYQIPQNLKQYTNPGFDVELLPNDNILFLLPGKGVYEVNRSGDTVWSYLDNKVSHDADRLPNGNTLVVFGNNDKAGDAQVREISPEGKIVWSWYARGHFFK